jgi:hypothetical protein
VKKRVSEVLLMTSLSLTTTHSLLVTTRERKSPLFLMIPAAFALNDTFDLNNIKNLQQIIVSDTA